jgi:hypothetical protein
VAKSITSSLLYTQFFFFLDAIIRLLLPAWVCATATGKPCPAVTDQAIGIAQFDAKFFAILEVTGRSGPAMDGCCVEIISFT